MENAGCQTQVSSAGSPENETGTPDEGQGAGEYRHTVSLKEPVQIPGRSQLIISVEMHLEEEMLCLSQQIDNGVFLANGLLPSGNQRVPLGILNACSNPVVLTNLTLVLKPTKDYSIVSLTPTQILNQFQNNVPSQRPKSPNSGACDRSKRPELINLTDLKVPPPSEPVTQATTSRISDTCESNQSPEPVGLTETPLSTRYKFKCRNRKPQNQDDACEQYKRPELIYLTDPKAPPSCFQEEKHQKATREIENHPHPRANLPRLSKPKKSKYKHRKTNPAEHTAILQHLRYLYPDQEDPDDSIDDPRLAKLSEELNFNKTLNAEEATSITKLCHEYNDIFHLPGDRLTCTDAITHEIPLVQDQAPINQKMYRLPETQRQVINDQLREMLDNDIVQPSKSPWNSPLLVVPKKAGPDGEKRWRVVVDFRKLNEKTIGDAFPLPRIEDILDQLGHARYFTTLDLASGYHQVLVEPRDRPKTAFSTAYGHYEFKRMPFGLKGAPATFQRLMNYVLTGLQGLECFVYLDDIVIYGKNLEDHNNKLRKVFDKLRENNLKLQPEKCQFLRKEVVYLGHKCSSEGAQPDPSKTACVQTFPIPRTVRQVQSFLGLANYYRKFIPDFSKIVRPITNLLRKDVKFKWTDKCQEAFEEIKSSLISPPLLIYPDFNKPFNLTTDASNEAIGAVLSQGEIGKDQPIAYASRSLNKAERNYSTIEKELLAIVWAVKNFRCYLQGRRFTIYTDHKPLKGVFNVKDPTTRLVRFHHKLSEFDYNIEYKPGKYNTNADALSRIPQNIDNLPDNSQIMVKADIHHQMDSDVEENTPPGSIKEQKRLNAITRAQAKRVSSPPPPPKRRHNKNSELEPMEGINPNKSQQSVLVTPEPINTPKEDALHPNNHPSEETISNDAKHPPGPAATDAQSRTHRERPEVITSPEEIMTILKDYHDSPFGGHQGVIKTYKRIRRKYWWKRMLRDIKTYIKKCKKCQTMKATPQYRMPMVITDIAEKPFDKVYLDIVGPLEETVSGNKYILTFQDNLTKFVDWYALPNAEAETIAQIFFDEIVTRYRIPKKIVTDQGTNFLSDLFKQVCRLLRVKKLQTSAYHPQSNGALERAHRPLIEYLRTVTDENPQAWDRYLRTAAFVYNNSIHEGTKLTPMDCLFGFTADVPSNLKRDPEPLYNSESYYHLLRHKLQSSYAVARRNLLNNKLKSKTYYDQKSRPHTYHVGDRVLIRNESKKHKLSQLWKGPYTIVSVISPVNSAVKIGKRQVVVHNNRLKPYFE